MLYMCINCVTICEVVVRDGNQWGTIMKERKQAIFSVRMDAEIKREFTEICNKMGISTAAAINMFAHQVVIEGGMPFRPTIRVAPEKQGFHEAIERARADAEKAGTLGMSLEEINEEIRLCREGK